MRLKAMAQVRAQTMAARISRKIRQPGQPRCLARRHDHGGQGKRQRENGVRELHELGQFPNRGRMKRGGVAAKLPWATTWVGSRLVSLAILHFNRFPPSRARCMRHPQVIQHARDHGIRHLRDGLRPGVKGRVGRGAGSRPASSRSSKFFTCTRLNGVSRGTRISFLRSFNTTSAARSKQTR